MVTCPKCGSANVATVGAGWVYYHYRCLSCGYEWSEWKWGDVVVTGYIVMGVLGIVYAIGKICGWWE